MRKNLPTLGDLVSGEDLMRFGGKTPQIGTKKAPTKYTTRPKRKKKKYTK